MEAPSAAHLAHLSLTKNFEKEILATMSKISSHIKGRADVSHSTQYIVGAAQESDKDILTSIDSLYRSYHLKRAYFSAFQPVPKTPLAHLSPAPLLRENRLYQSDFLIRLYHFSFQDLVFDTGGNLDLEMDPKLAYALQHPELFPLDINKAPYYQLLRIPGIGPKSAAKIVQVRRSYHFTDPRELKNAGVVMKRALSFITLNGHYFGNRRLLSSPQKTAYQQLSLWGDQRDFMFQAAGSHN